jgi:exopolysaccharide biosynthesis polyprenyl glycosylphosphotransferase
MNATERAALLQGVELFNEMSFVVDDRTLDILDRRRRTAVIQRRGWLVRRMLAMADVLGLVLAFVVAEWIVTAHNDRGAVDAPTETLIFLATLPLWVVIAKIYGLYERDEERTDHSTADDFAGVFHVVTVCTFTFAMGSYLTHLAHPTPGKLVIFWAAAIAFVSVGRATARAGARRHAAYLQNTVIVGAGDVGQLVAKKLLQHPEYGLNLVGFLDADPKERTEELAHLALLGGPDRLTAIVRLFDIERVIIAFSNESHEDTLDLIRSLKDLEVQIDIVPRLYELVGSRVGIYNVEGLPLVGLPPLRLSRSSRALKRSMDVVLAAVGLVLLAPLFAVVAALIRFESPGPVLFRQVRMGADERTFRIFKFRSMTADADRRKHEVAHLNKHLGGDERMFKIPDDPRVTRVGKVLRKTSIDELPQLFNVLLGHMSLVGPRPLILDEDQYVDSWARRRLDLKPGMTGLWQVLGRSGIPFEEMVKLDYLYVTSWSLPGDLGLIARTLPALFGTRHAGTH